MLELKNEFSVKVCGREYVLRPDFESIMQFESVTGESVALISSKLVGNKDTDEVMRQFKMRWIAAAFYAGLYGTKDAITFEQAGELVYKNGLINSMSILSDFATMSLAGEQTEKKPSAELGESSKTS